MLSASDVSVSYGARRVLEGANLELRPGEILGVYGDSGSGKTSLGKVLAGWLTPDEGSVSVDGEPAPRKGFQPVQLISQHPERAIDPHLRLSYAVKGVDQDLLDDLGVEPEWLRRRAGELSGGQLQRLNIARALRPETRYVIADEITTMLDGITQANLWQVVVAQARIRNLGMLVISHDFPLLGHVTDRVVALADLQ